MIMEPRHALALAAALTAGFLVYVAQGFALYMLYPVPL